MKNRLKHIITTAPRNVGIGVAMTIATLFSNPSSSFAQDKSKDALIANEGSNRVSTSKEQILKEAKQLDHIAAMYFQQNQMEKALEYFLKALEKYEQIDDQKDIRGVTNDIGKIYHRQGNVAEATKYYIKAQKLAENIPYLRGVLISKMMIAETYFSQKKFAEAETLLFENIKIIQEKRNEIENPDELLGRYIQNRAGSLFEQGKGQNVEKDIQKLLDQAIAQNDTNNIITLYYNMGDILFKMKNDNTGAYQKYNDGLEKAKADSVRNLEKEGYEKLKDFYAGQNDREKAYAYQELATNLKDEITSEQTLKAQKEMETKYETAKKKAQIKIQEGEMELQKSEIQRQSEKQKKLRWAIAAALLGVLGAASIGYIQYKKKIIERKQKAEISQQKEEITAQRDEIEAQMHQIEEQMHIISEQKTEITDSINYAKRIQNAILTPPEEREADFSDTFMLFKPRNVVSGDFYRFKKIPGGKRFIAAPDCTGHGVPGAFMSIINCDLLNDAIKEGNETPADILNYANETLPDKFNQKKRTRSAEDFINDTMDIALCSIDDKNRTLQFAGAKNPLVIIRKGEAIKMEPDTQAIGKKIGHLYENQEIQLESGDIVYLFSDGYQDQFGGPKNKKFLSKNLRELFARISTEDLKSQKQQLENEFQSRRGANEQVDDILIIGIKII